jgi:ABC-type uncharacterized transport system auxiliary subunit
VKEAALTNLTPVSKKEERKTVYPFLLFCLGAIFMILITGCLPGSKPPYLIEQYTLEYRSPTPPGLAHGEESITVDRFSVDQVFNSTAMLYRPEAYRLAAYNYHRWRVNPGDMTGDCLLRDLGQSGIFRAVFSYRNAVATRFVLQGGVGEFVELREKDSPKALLRIVVALIDSKEQEITRKLVFQKEYTFMEPLSESSPAALAGAMSSAVAKLSEQLMKDLDAAIKDRK